MKNEQYNKIQNIRVVGSKFAREENQERSILYFVDYDSFILT